MNISSEYRVLLSREKTRPLPFSKNLTCDLSYHPHGFDWSSLVMVVIASICVLALAKFGRIYAFKIIMRRYAKGQYSLVENNIERTTAPTKMITSSKASI